MQKSVLIIDDEQLPRKAIIRKFTAEQFLVYEATDGKAGLALALQTHPDLIVLDIMLPVMGGYEVMNNLRKDEWGKHVPIIILTNLSLDYAKTASIAADHPAYVLEKANSTLDEVVTKAKEVLKLEWKVIAQSLFCFVRNNLASASASHNYLFCVPLPQNCKSPRWMAAFSSQSMSLSRERKRQVFLPVPPV